uniref:Uncharacterized protein n=1 Tax=Equus asinus asinus TaxID=83772 RepID=A0A8C4M420_EQUAS
MRLVLLLPVLLVALWMVCEGPSWAQAVPEPAGILDVLPDTVKKIAHTLGNKDQGLAIFSHFAGSQLLFPAFSSAPGKLSGRRHKRPTGTEELDERFWSECALCL